MRFLKMATMTSASLVALVLVLGAFHGCKAQSTATITQELSDDLTDNMNFQNGTKVSGTPPQENKGSTTAPQVTVAYKGPATLSPGDSFTLTLTTDYAQPGAVDGAVVYVDNVDKVYDRYIKVTQSISGGAMVLTGTIEANSWLLYDSATFGLKVGLASGSKVGNYADQPISVLGVGAPSGDTVCEPFTMSGCSNVRACCTTYGSQCWYEANGKKFMCASNQNCQAAAQALANYCMGI